MPATEVVRGHEIESSFAKDAHQTRGTSKRGTSGGRDRESEEMIDKMSSSWETLQTEGGKILDTVQSRGQGIIDTAKVQASKLASKAQSVVSGSLDDHVREKPDKEDDEGEWNEVSYEKRRHRGGKVKGEMKDEIKGRVRGVIGHQKAAINSLFDRIQMNGITFQDIMSYLVPLLVLALALTAGIAAYRSYVSAPAPLPPWNTLEGVKARANMDYLHDNFDYATEKAALLADQLKDNVGIYADQAKASLWKTKDLAAEQANIAYKEALKKAHEAKKTADAKSREALADLRTYARHQTQPEGFFDKLGYKWDQFKEGVAERTGMMAENAKHQAAMQAENARHKAAEAKIKGAHTGMGAKIKEAVHDVKESVKATIHDKI